MSPRSHPDVVVCGAGAFGGWTAFTLATNGARVALVDPWPPGHPRGTSSGDVRVIRCSYGPREIYLRWARRSWDLWRKYERRWRTRLLVPCGVLWLLEDEDYFKPRLASLAAHGIPCESLSLAELRRRYPQLHPEGIACGYLEPEAGILFARRATKRVVEEFLALPRRDGVTRLHTAAVLPPRESGPRLQKIALSNGKEISAGAFVFACGPWLPQIFPDLLSRRIRVTRQEEYYFGTPAADARFTSDSLPVWIEPATDFYGLPACGHIGLKVANDRSGPPFDPTSGDRGLSAAELAATRAYLARRLPALAAAPLVESRVCQYERTPDAHLILDCHPQFENVWIVGGGSGHGFKLGPALGEIVARLALDCAPPRPLPGPYAPAPIPDALLPKNLSGRYDRSRALEEGDVVPEMSLSGAFWPDSGPAPKPTSY